MSIYITDPDLVTKIGEVEGPAWVNNERRSQDRGKLDYTACGAKLYWVQHQADVAEEKRELGDKWEDWMDETHYSIYGGGGWNRYYLRKDGRVVFSKSHTATGSIEKAIAAGFDVE